MDIESGGAPWDLYLAFIRRPAETVVRVQYNPDLFEAGMIARMLEDYQTLLCSVSDNPTGSLSQIEFRSRHEQQPVLAGGDS